ncbi:sigma 54-interacting transcriptional regulator [Desulfococcaceae bacterium HSG9]|nr:sigma 54-interacting transcriptional regulator [Desulfococcaceae bacterium HSG9]
MAFKTHEIWNNRFLNLIIDSMADGVFTLDAKGRISSWNASMERISGYSSTEALGQTCRLLQFNRCFGLECPGNLSECGIFKHGQAKNDECMLCHKDGRDVSVIKNARAVRDENGVIIGVVETLTDLTELKKARRKAEEAAWRLEEKHHFGNIIGKSAAMRQVFTAIQAAAASHANILIEGQSGTGKELVAGAIHFNSALKENPLVTVNCSALSESLLESELFGHVKGAFTGAMRNRKGRFEEAHGGTVFLDEIGEISPFIQVKLLRVLQEREVERVGESRKRKINIRVVAATHRDLHDLVRKGHFREDLYYRLKVFPIKIPPLREHKEDIPLLINHFIKGQNKMTGKTIGSVSQAAMRIILDYAWPGNVRELENAIEHAFVLCSDNQIDAFDLPLEIRQMHYEPLQAEKTPAVPTRSRKKLVKTQLLTLLDACEWNKAEVARRVGLSRTAIWKYMKKWEIPLQPPSS